MSTPDPARHFEDAGIEIDISSANLSYFSPGANPETPPSPSEAWFVLNGAAMPKIPPNDQADIPGFYFNYLGYLLGDDLLLTLPHGKAIPAMLGDKGGSSDETSNGGIFGGTYYWPVPASTRSARLQINLPPKLPAESSYIGSPETVPVKGAIKPMTFTFSAAYHPHPSAGAGANPPPYAPRSVPNATGVSRRGPAIAPAGSGAPLVLLLVAVGLLGLAYVSFVLKHRRLLPSWLTPGPRSPAEKRATEATIWLRSQPGDDGATQAAAEANALPTPLPDSATEPAPGTLVAPAGTDSQALAPSSTASARQSNLGVLLRIPDEPRPPPDGCLEVVLCAPTPSVTGWPDRVEPPGSSLLALLAFLAWHQGQSFTTENLRAKIGAGRTSQLSTRTIGTYMNQLRRALGSQRVPEAGAGAGYRIVGISTDARRLEELVALAGSDPANAPEHLSNALSLLQGVPFSQVTGGPWRWADVAGESVTGAVADAVLDAATQLGRVAIAAGDAKLAAWAADKGLLLWRQDWDLNKMALDAAGLSHEPSALPRAWNELVRRFAAPTPEDDEPIPDELLEHYQNLRRRSQHKDPPAP